MKKTDILFLAFFVFISSKTYSQDSSAHVSPFSFSGYVDVYAAYFSDSLSVNDYQKYTTISPRSKQAGLNIAMFTAKYDDGKIRSQVTLHVGDVPRSSWSANYNIIQEANVGLKLNKKLWIEAGFFRTHFGTEALLPKENYTSSVSIPTFFEPYYEGGIRLCYYPSDRLSFFVYGLNGFNTYEDNNSQKSIGFLATYVANPHVNFGYSGYFGDDAPDHTRTQFRNFHNVFLNIKANKLKLTTGFDYEMQEHSLLKNPNKPATLYTGLLIISYEAAKNFSVYTRGEIFNDKDGFMSGSMIDKKGKTTGLIINGVTLGMEYKTTANSYIRLEVREVLTDKNQEIFRTDGKSTNMRTEIMLNMGLTIQ